MMPAKAIRGRVGSAVNHMCKGNVKWASGLTGQISETLTSGHPRVIEGWDDGTQHVLWANVSYDGQNGVNWRCPAQDLTWGEVEGVRAVGYDGELKQLGMGCTISPPGHSYRKIRVERALD